MFSRFFIERPIFASVLSIVIVVAGVASLGALPIAEYPNLAPATIQVTASYPGADPQVIADTVAAPIEQEVNGVEGMLYMKSTSSSDGSYSLAVTFATGTDLDIASVQVQNRVAAAEPRLPEDVRRLGIKTQKQMPDFALMLSVSSPDGRYDDVFLSNYATLNIRDPLKRVNGVGDVRVFGAAEYSMRVWLDPVELDARDLSPAEIVAAIREQNVQVAAGKIGEPPAPAGTPFQFSVSTRGRLIEPREFERIVVRTGADGRVLRLGDVARIELGAQNYAMESTVDGKPAAVLALYQLPGANLIDIADRVAAQIDALRPGFPEGLDVAISYDASQVVRASIEEIVITLFVAALLVILTVLIFLQDFRATLIPTVTIPVSLIGCFAVMAALGFSLNTLTLFGIVLAIGIVVDDAIVVVENVARNLDENPGMSPREAAIKAMNEVTGPVIATTLVLLAVFVPTSFLGGITGVMYQQFGLTIAAATVFSSVNALTMSPALAGVLMRRSTGRKNLLFRAFDRSIDAGTEVYTRFVGAAVRKAAIAMLVFVGLSVAGLFGMAQLPGGFVPGEDKGYFLIADQLPDAASRERTRAVTRAVEAVLSATPGVASHITIGGYSLIDGAANSNVGSHIVVLEPWSERSTPELQQTAIVRAVQRRLGGLQSGVAFAFEVPPIPGVGLAGGFDMQVQDRGGLGVQALQGAAQSVAAAAAGQSNLAGVNSSFRATAPKLWVDVDRDKVKQIGLPLQSVFDTLQTYLGGTYANDFNAFGRTFQVRMQAEPEARAAPEDITRLRLRDAQGRSVPIGAVATVEERFGPPFITRYNLYPAASVKGGPAPGVSSGQALTLMEEVADRTLPQAMGYEWTGLSFQEKQASGQIAMIFLLALLLVYLVLAAQYESWTLPIAVLLAVPLGFLGVAAAAFARGYDNNVYTQIGIVLLIALIAKNAILIVEFAREKRKEGLSPADAAIEAARLRFRPILMTAVSFVLGTAPLVIATGAGAGARTALGTAVFFGLLGATVFGLVLTPVIYRVVQGAAERGDPAPTRPAKDAAGTNAAEASAV